MKNYLYKNISLFLSGGKWQADYAVKGERFALHRCSAKTKTLAYELAQEQVDYLNKRHGFSDRLEEDGMNPIIKRNTDEETILTMLDDEIMVDFRNIGEGYYGDYNPDDPEDKELIRFDVSYRNPDTNEWTEVDDASYCTTLEANSPIEELEGAIRTIFKEYKDVYRHICEGGSVKKLGEELSWI